MYRYSYIGLLLLVTILMGCADQDAPKADEGLVGVDLAFSVPAPLVRGGGAVPFSAAMSEKEA